MRYAAIFFLLALTAACGSSSGPAKPGTVLPAKPELKGPFGPAAEGEGCNAGSDCSEGLFCLPILPAQQGENTDVFGGYRCVSACTVDEHCPEGTCFASRAPDRVSPCSSDDACAAQLDPSYCPIPKGSELGSCQPYGFCGHSRIEGESCSSAQLSFCSAADSTHPLVCYRGDAENGVCMVHCDPNVAAPPCQAGEFCAGIFADPNFGICVSPDPTGVCDLKTRFCDKDQLCISAPSGTTSRCFEGCDVSSPTCGAGTTCTLPLADQQAVCARTAGTGDGCDPETFLFCAPGDLCVDESAAKLGTNCRRVCKTEGDTCPDGTQCVKLVSTGWACLPYSGP